MTAENAIAIAEDDEDTFFASEEELDNILARMLDPLFKDILRSWGRGFHSNLPETIKKLLVQKALAEAKGNQVQAAKMLGINRNLLCNHIDKYKLLLRKPPRAGEAFCQEQEKEDSGATH